MVASLHRKNKGLWPPFPLSTKVCNIESFKQAKDEVGLLTSYKFREVNSRRHDPQGNMKEHLQQVGFIWSYSHDDLLPRELSQQQVLVKSRIPTLDQMTQVDKEAEIHKDKEEKSRVVVERKNPIRIKDEEESSSSSSMSMYSLDSEKGRFIYSISSISYFDLTRYFASYAVRGSS